jgi:hypothetical protein
MSFSEMNNLQTIFHFYLFLSRTSMMMMCYFYSVKKEVASLKDQEASCVKKRKKNGNKIPFFLLGIFLFLLYDEIFLTD